MNEVIRRFIWFTVVASIVAYATFLLIGSIVEAQAAQSPVAIRDDISPNTHQLSGMVMVPSSCYELTVRTEQRSINDFVLVFKTWQDPSISCPDAEEVPRAFHAILFAPSAGINISALFDGSPLPIAVIPTLASRVPAGSVKITTVNSGTTQ